METTKNIMDKEDFKEIIKSGPKSLDIILSTQISMGSSFVKFKLKDGSRMITVDLKDKNSKIYAIENGKKIFDEPIRKGFGEKWLKLARDKKGYMEPDFY